MGKSSQKSATKVDAAPVDVSPVKSGKKVKRQADEEIKKVSAKKQKVEGLVAEQKKEAVIQKVQKVKEESKESSSEDEHVVVWLLLCCLLKVLWSQKPVVKAAAPVKKPSAKNGNAKKAKPESSSESDEDDSSDEDDASAKKPAPKKAEVAVKPNAKKAKPESSSSESDEDDSSDEDGASAKKPAPKKAEVAVKPNQAPKKEESSDESDDESDDVLSEDEKPAPKSVPPKNGSAPAKKAASSSDDESDEDSSSNEEAPKAKVVPAAVKPAPSKKPAKSSDSDSSEESDSDDDEKTSKASNGNKKAVTVSKTETKDVEMIDADKSSKKAPATPATSNENGGSKILFVGNLSFNVKRSDIENFFQECGEVVDVRLSSEENGRLKGFGHVEFATAEAAQSALELNGQELLQRGVRIDLARERGAYTPNSNSGKGQSQTVFVSGFDKCLGVDEIRVMLEQHFSSCGQVTRLSIPKVYDSGNVKGFAFMDFKDSDSFNKALELHESELDGYSLSVVESKPRDRGRFGDRGGPRGRFGDRGGPGRFGDRSGPGRSGGRDGSRRGGRFGFNKPSLVPEGKNTTFADDE